MKKFKFILSALTALLLAGCLAGCGEYKPPQSEVGGGQNPPIITPDPKPTPPDNPPSGDPTDDSFKVTLICDNAPFTRANYSGIMSLRVQWTNIETKQVHRAYFNEGGVASIDGLDGDYKVTLVDLPDGYTYEPNIYSADNDYKQISIQLFKLTPLPKLSPYGGAIDGEVQGTVKVYDISSIGAYRVTLKSAEDKVFFRYQPGKNGVYQITSMVDVTANEINPWMDIHFGSIAYINPTPAVRQDGGAVENTYTKNFNAEYTVSPDEAQGAVFIFRLYSTCRNKDAYPLGVDFILDRDGDFKRQDPVTTPVPVTEDFDNTPLTPEGTFDWCANRSAKKLLDEKTVKLNEDGYYYYINLATGDFYKDSDGKALAQYRLYAAISKVNPVMGTTFTDTKVGKGNLNGYDYSRFVSTYAAHCNVDGCYPVNEELKGFLQNYAQSDRIFYDGKGVAEEFEHYVSDERSMWMFACGYYKP
ncbi:MAG: hypothetical protein K2K39_00665 [Clostridia bacterium]|nr:hypothetical protein [Clostridia bacterium]